MIQSRHPKDNTHAPPHASVWNGSWATPSLISPKQLCTQRCYGKEERDTRKKARTPPGSDITGLLAGTELSITP